jgi:hypothetical protein
MVHGRPNTANTATSHHDEEHIDDLLHYDHEEDLLGEPSISSLLMGIFRDFARYFPGICTICSSSPFCISVLFHFQECLVCC